jgi:hypothetical protein
MTKPTLRIFTLALLLLGLWAQTAVADDLADAKAVISKQIDAIKQGDEAVVRKHFTARLREKITADAIKAAQKQVGTITLDELVGSVAPGKDSLKIKMKNGRTLTTLVKVDGQWLADTIWFK